MAISSSCLDVAPGLRLIGSIYLTENDGWIAGNALQKSQNCRLDNALLARFSSTISTPIFESARDRLFQQPLVYIFGIIPVLGMLLMWRLFTSLDRKEERAFRLTILLFVLTFIGLALVVFPHYSFSNHHLWSICWPQFARSWLSLLASSFPSCCSNLISTLSFVAKSRVVIMEIREVQLNMTQPVEPRAAPITTHHKWWVVYQSSVE